MVVVQTEVKCCRTDTKRKEEYLCHRLIICFTFAAWLGGFLQPCPMQFLDKSYSSHKVIKNCLPVLIQFGEPKTFIDIQWMRSMLTCTVPLSVFDNSGYSHVKGAELVRRSFWNEIAHDYTLSSEITIDTIPDFLFAIASNLSRAGSVSARVSSS